MSNLKRICQEVSAAGEKATERPWRAFTKKAQDHKVFFIEPDDSSNVFSNLELATLYDSGNDLAKNDTAYIVLSANHADKFARALIVMDRLVSLVEFDPRIPTRLLVEVGKARVEIEEILK